MFFFVIARAADLVMASDSDTTVQVAVTLQVTVTLQRFSQGPYQVPACAFTEEDIDYIEKYYRPIVTSRFTQYLCKRHAADNRTISIVKDTTVGFTLEIIRDKTNEGES